MATAVELLRQGHRKVIGLDITPAMIAYGSENITRAEMGSQIRQTCGSGMHLPFAASSFDMAICGLGTHHMDVRLLLAELRRGLRVCRAASWTWIPVSSDYGHVSERISGECRLKSWSRCWRSGKLIGILLLGPKLSELAFSSEEQLVLDTLANQTAVAVENARLFSETVVEKERTATILEQAFAGIILLDWQLKILSLNPAAEAILGFSEQQVIGAPRHGPGSGTGQASRGCARWRHFGRERARSRRAIHHHPASGRRSGHLPGV